MTRRGSWIVYCHNLPHVVHVRHLFGFYPLLYFVVGFPPSHVLCPATVTHSRCLRSTICTRAAFGLANPESGHLHGRKLRRLIRKTQSPPPIKRQPPPVRPCGHQRIFRVRYIQLPLMASFSTGSSTSVMVPHTQEEPIQRNKGYGTFSKDDERRRRRHSSHHHTNHARPWAVDSENVQLLVCRHTPRLCGAVANSVT